MSEGAKTLAVVHVFYPQFWPELAACLRNVGGPLDVVVTYVDDAAVSAVRGDFPAARFVKTANCGFDVWPFLKVLQETDLSPYGCVVKLHTKRDFNPAYESRPFCGYDLRGPRWRERLLRFVASPEAWRRTVRQLERPEVGMVADDALIVRRNATVGASYGADFDRAVALLGGTCGGPLAAGAYVAGTMFAAKPAALAPLLRNRIGAADFDVSRRDGPEQFAHVCERALGLSVTAAGLELVGFEGAALKMRAIALLGGLWYSLRRFLWQDKVTGKGCRMVKCCRIPVYYARENPR